MLGVGDDALALNAGDSGTRHYVAEERILVGLPSIYVFLKMQLFANARTHIHLPIHRTRIHSRCLFLCVCVCHRVFLPLLQGTQSCARFEERVQCKILGPVVHSLLYQKILQVHAFGDMK